MTASKAKNLSTIFRSAKKVANTSTSTSTSAAAAEEDAKLKSFFSTIDTSSSSSSSRLVSEAIIKKSKKSRARAKKYVVVQPASSVVVPKLSDDVGEELKGMADDISTILTGDNSVDSPESQVADDENVLEGALEIPWAPYPLKSTLVAVKHKEVSRERKQKWIFKNTQESRFDRLVKMCAFKLGSETTIEVFSKLGKETGVKEYNALIRICIDKARASDDDEAALQQFYKAFQLFKSMREQGFQIQEQTYGPFLKYLVDRGMVPEFQFFCKVVREGNPESISRLGYYEMLLWARVNNKAKIQELTNFIIDNNGEDNAHLKENYLLALCDSGRKEELIQVLQTIDISEISSNNGVTSIFKSLGKLSLESFAEKLLVVLKTSDCEVEDISDVIFHYVTNIPNLVVENIVVKFEELHMTLEMTPSSASYEKLITHCCNLGKVHTALGLIDHLCEGGLSISVDTLNSLLRACEENCEYNLVRRIYPFVRKHKMKPNSESFRSLINLSVRMKDFAGAYNMLEDLKEMNLMPTCGMYNAILGGYYREKNIPGAREVLNKMKSADLKPDSQTYSYLISNCDREEDIIKYYEEMKQAGVQVQKHVYMALINAYAACGQFEKAKKVLADKDLPNLSVNEIRSTLVSALASHGKISEAINMYEEIKKAGWSLEPKAVIAVIENLQCEGELSRLLQLLKELQDQDYWFDACYRVISYCIRHKHLSAAVDLLKQLKDGYSTDELAMEVLFDEAFSLVAEWGPTHLQFGINLLQAIKNDLGLYPSRKCLDFLLGTSVVAKNLQTSCLIWKEYQAAGLPYNVLSFVRMYQGYLASGNYKSASKIRKNISLADPHVALIVKSYQTTYSTKSKNKKGK